MDSRAFKSGLERVLLLMGFEKKGRALERSDSGVSTLIACSKGFGEQWSIDVGFWLEALGQDRPDRVEQAHLYFRLERLVPEYRETILLAGALNDADQPAAYKKMLELLPSIDSGLRIMGTEAGLRTAMAEGRLGNGLVRKEARAYLDG
jgi:hypothetical protein